MLLSVVARLVLHLPCVLVVLSMGMHTLPVKRGPRVVICLDVTLRVACVIIAMVGIVEDSYLLKR